MENSCSNRLAWSVPATCLPLEDAQRILAPLELSPEPLDPSGPLATEAGWMVLHPAGFGDLPQLSQAWERLGKPGLIVVDSAAEETQALRLGLPPSLDLCRADMLPEQLADRLQRLRKGSAAGQEYCPVALGQRAPDKLVHSRAYLDARLAREFASARKHCRSLSLAWIALAHLPRVGERQGETAEFQLVRAFSQIVFGNIRVTDWLARYSRDEFCLAMPDTWLEEGRGVALRIQAALASARLEINGLGGFAPSAAIGVAELTDHEQSYEDLIQKASEAALLESLAARAGT